MILYDKTKAYRRTATFSWTDRETMLYALSVGVCRDPMNLDELAFVYEGKGPKVLPTYPVVLSRFEFLEDCGVTFTHLLHAGQRLVVCKQLPPQGTITTETFVTEVYDKGKDKGALICLEVHGKLQDTGELAYKMMMQCFATADGGFGGPSGGPARHRLPERKPDRVSRFTTREDQALIYRLNVDRNPLHADPAAAALMKFPRPILHGLCSYGIAGWVMVRDLCAYDHTRLKELDVRFSKPVFPGETLEFDIWQDGDEVSFRGRVAERNVVVMDEGRCLLSPAK